MVRVGELESACSRGAARIAPEHQGQLLAGDIVIGAEFSAAVTGHDALGRGPAHRLGVPRSFGDILKLHQVIDRGTALTVVENLDQLCAGDGLLGAEGAVAKAVHKAVFQAVMHAVMIPGGGIRVGKGPDGAGAVLGAGLIPAGDSAELGPDGHGPVWHGEGVRSAVLFGELDVVPTAVGDGKGF